MPAAESPDPFFAALSNTWRSVELLEEPLADPTCCHHCRGVLALQWAGRPFPTRVYIAGVSAAMADTCFMQLSPRCADDMRDSGRDARARNRCPPSLQRSAVRPRRSAR
jgi:hypothetical protein